MYIYDSYTFLCNILTHHANIIINVNTKIHAKTPLNIPIPYRDI